MTCRPTPRPSSSFVDRKGHPNIQEAGSWIALWSLSASKPLTFRTSSARGSRPLLCGGLRRRLPRDEFPAVRRFCPGVEEYELQAARLAVDFSLDRRAAGDECGIARQTHLAIAASRVLVLRPSRAEGGKPCILGVREPRGVGIEKLAVEHRLESGEIAAAHGRVA